MGGPLEGTKILDMSRILAGPWAGQLLGDYGADVIKVERPHHGDDTRHWGPPWLGDDPDSEAAYFLAANRNKRSITIDISHPKGQRLIRDLVAEADVLIENYRVGTMSRYGLSADDLRRDNPGLIYCSISAYGQHGSRADEPGYDAMIQASAGLMSITGAPDSEGGSPQKVGVAIADIMAGMYATTAILAALEERRNSGEGQTIDVPLYDSQVAWLANQAMNFLIGGGTPERRGTAHPNLVPYQTFATSDGHCTLAVGNDNQFAACAACMSLPELGTDPRFATNADRVNNRDALVPILANELQAKPTQHWLRVFKDAGVPAGPINSIADVLTDGYAVERDLVKTLNHALDSALPTVANPVGFSRTPVVYGASPPMLGEHTESILSDWLGYSADQIETLRASGAR
jgi:crotonobetainyl-CoA:carnitine CoA-transferase CaiB-like acyl-CoA transferase